MSYSAFEKLQKNVEIEFIKSKTPEELNDIFRQLKAVFDDSTTKLAAVTQELEQAKAELNSKQSIICQQGEWLEVLESKLEQLKQSSVVMPESIGELKGLLRGEFNVEVEHSCSACSYHEVQEDCEVCGGEITWTEKHAIPWTTIKDVFHTIRQALATNDKEKDNG